MAFRDNYVPITDGVHEGGTVNPKPGHAVELDGGQTATWHQGTKPPTAFHDDYAEYVQLGTAAEPQWAEWRGFRILTGVEIETINYRRVNDWKGYDEVEGTVIWSVTMNHHDAAEGSAWTVPDAMASAQLAIRKLQEPGPINWTDSDPYAELRARMIYYQNTPAVIMSVIDGDLRLVIACATADGRFPPRPYQIESAARNEDDFDPYDETLPGEAETVVVEYVHDEHIWWWREIPAPRDAELRAEAFLRQPTCPKCHVPLVPDEMNGWQHYDGSIGHHNDWDGTAAEAVAEAGFPTPPTALEWGQKTIEGSLEMKAGGFRENQHPRDSHGKFIRTGASVSLPGGGIGRVMRVNGDGSVVVQHGSGGRNSSRGGGGSSRVTETLRSDQVSVTRNGTHARDDEGASVGIGDIVHHNGKDHTVTGLDHDQDLGGPAGGTRLRLSAHDGSGDTEGIASGDAHKLGSTPRVGDTVPLPDGSRGRVTGSQQPSRSTSGGSGGARRSGGSGRSGGSRGSGSGRGRGTDLDLDVTRRGAKLTVTKPDGSTHTYDTETIVNLIIAAARRLQRARARRSTP